MFDLTASIPARTRVTIYTAEFWKVSSYYIEINPISFIIPVKRWNQSNIFWTIHLLARPGLGLLGFLLLHAFFLVPAACPSLFDFLVFLLKSLPFPLDRLLCRCRLFDKVESDRLWHLFSLGRQCKSKLQSLSVSFPFPGYCSLWFSHIPTTPPPPWRRGAAGWCWLTTPLFTGTGFLIIWL